MFFEDELIINMLFSADYSQFLQSTGDVPSYDQAITPTFMQGRQYADTSLLDAQHDFVYSEFTDTIAKRLFAMAYPTNLKGVNPFCPLCLRLVRNEDAFSGCYLGQDRCYLIHWSCMEKDKNYQMKTVGDVLKNVAVVEEAKIMRQRTMVLGTDSRKFYAEVSFSHPIHEKNFVKVNTRSQSSRNQLTINFDEKEDNIYYPNVVVLPMTDFLLEVNLVQFGPKGYKGKQQKYISLRNFKDKKMVNIQCQEVHLSAEIIQDKQEQHNLMEKMNYKYKFEAQGLAMIRIFSIAIKLPQDMEDSDEDEFLLTSSNNIEELLREKEPSVVSIRSSSQSPVKPCSQLTSSGELMLEGEKVNLDTLISTNGLIDYVKNNIQSRQFQQFLNDCPDQDLDKVINYVGEYLVELVMHEYGNYMVQKLFKVCNARQRLNILQIIMPSLCDLARNKQGTHTVQAFISQFKDDAQFSLVYMQIGAEYYELCKNNNATHFIQKIIKTFPLKFMIVYFNYTVQNLLAFALDKNAMCVIKHMIRQFRSLQGHEGEYYNNMEQIRRQLIINVTFNADRLIMDSYGNYVIQFCYELFDIERCAAITERILSKFATYAVGKYSSNVIIKCISSYWTDKGIYSSLKLLPNNQVVEIFRNKDGNKILLEIMEKLEGSDLWDRLYSILVRLEPTRYYHDRWGVCLGSRSGTQVGRNINFPEPRYRQKRKVKQSIQ